MRWLVRWITRTKHQATNLETDRHLSDQLYDRTRAITAIHSQRLKRAGVLTNDLEQIRTGHPHDEWNGTP